MAVRNIVLYAQDAALLRKKSKPIRGMGRSVKHLVQDLKDTLMHGSDGIGLAAPQIGELGRVVVVRLGSRNENKREPDPPIALINPKIVEAGNEQKDFDGCLSFPGLYGETVRPHYLSVTGLDERGRSFDRVFEGFDAVVVHHEIDHLDGVQGIEDLYRVRVGKDGEQVRVPVLAMNMTLNGS
jgi:peptide deformylase